MQITAKCFILLSLAAARLMGSPSEDIQAREAEITSECQARLQAVIDRADRFLAVPAIPRAQGPRFEVRGPEEVRSLLGGLRFVRPDIDWTSHEGLGVIHACRCIPEVRIVIYQREEVITEFLTRHGKFVEGPVVTGDSRMQIEESWLSKIYQRLGIKAMKKGEPGATDNPDDAQRN